MEQRFIIDTIRKLIMAMSASWPVSLSLRCWLLSLTV